MELSTKMDQLAHSQYAGALDMLRIVLGLIIFGKGLYFVENTGALMTMMENSKIEYVSFMLTHYVAMAHLVGGVLIATGLLTRIAVAFQVPILAGAIIFVNAQHGFYSIHSELAFSILTLCLLVFYLFYGSGPISIDEYLRKHRGV